MKDRMLYNGKLLFYGGALIDTSYIVISGHEWVDSSTYFQSFIVRILFPILLAVQVDQCFKHDFIFFNNVFSISLQIARRKWASHATAFC